MLVEQKRTDSHHKAQRLILAGQVLVDGQRVDKPGKLVEENSVIVFKAMPRPYVGRGGLKLEAPLDSFSINPRGKICLDIGASTGGFTDCLLQRGAKKVYAVDVGYGQFAWELRKDKRTVLLERENFRTMALEKIPDKVALVTIDVSFISLKLIFPPLKKLLASPAEILALVKPQFEVGPKEVGKKGVVKDPKLHQAVTEKIKRAGLKEGWTLVGIVPSPIRGAKGNQEFFIAFKQQ